MSGSEARSVDFIGVGAARSGTSWLVNVLREHPQICISEPKEIRYFNRYLVPVGPDKGERNTNFGKSLDWYGAHFAHAQPDQIRGEYSPVYFCDEAAPAAIHAHFPEVRLIICLRNPVDRAYSHYCFHRAQGVHSIATFEQAMRSDEGYVTMSLYARQLKRYLTYFDPRQIFVSIFEELVGSRGVELQRLLRFLNVRADCALDLSTRHTNAAVGLRSKTVKSFAHAFSRALVDSGHAAWLDRMRKLGVHDLWHSLMSRPVRHPPLALETRRELERYFSSDVTELETLLGRDLAVWGIGNRA